jgi:hypothetical protein
VGIANTVLLLFKTVPFSCPPVIRLAETSNAAVELPLLRPLVARVKLLAFLIVVLEMQEFTKDFKLVITSKLYSTNGVGLVISTLLMPTTPTPVDLFKYIFSTADWTCALKTLVSAE